MTAQTWRSATSLPEYDFLGCAVSTELNLAIRRPLLLRKTIGTWSPAQFSEDFTDMLVSGETAVDEARRTPPRGLPRRCSPIRQRQSRSQTGLTLQLLAKR